MPMKLNAEWHTRHPMPRKATQPQRVAWHRAHSVACACRPPPPALRRLIESPLRALLSGGDRRSVAQSKKANAILEREPKRIDELAGLAHDDDWLVGMRAVDLLEKLARAHPRWVQPHRAIFIGSLADSEQWEIRLQIVRALPLLRWTPKEYKRAIQILKRDVTHPQKFVRVWALDSLALFAQTDASLTPLVRRQLAAFERSGSKALTTRARQIRARVSATA